MNLSFKVSDKMSVNKTFRGGPRGKIPVPPTLGPPVPPHIGPPRLTTKSYACSVSYLIIATRHG